MKTSKSGLKTKARFVFTKQKTIYTNEGLSRMELRALERRGLIKKQLTQSATQRVYMYMAEERLWIL